MCQKEPSPITHSVLSKKSFVGRSELKQGNTIIHTIKGVITRIDSVEAIVTSTTYCASRDELRKSTSCNAGEAIINWAYTRPFFINTVSPKWNGGNEQEAILYADCYKKSLKLAMNRGLKSIAFPSIGTISNNFPLEKAAEIAVHTVSEFVSEYPDAFSEILWVLIDDNTKRVYDKALNELEKKIKRIEKKTKHLPCIVCFFNPNKEYGVFSNQYLAGFSYAGVHFASVEQFADYHMMLLFNRHDLADKIIGTEVPEERKKIAAQEFPEFNTELWESICKTIIKRGVTAKFWQNKDLRKELIDTGNSLLAYCSFDDRLLGNGMDIYDSRSLETQRWSGKNLLGEILMEVRAELRQYMGLLKTEDLEWVDATTMPPIFEWQMKPGELMYIPQFHDTVRAYAKTILSRSYRSQFFYDYSFETIEDLLLNKADSSPFPVVGFFEMKQEIYCISNILIGALGFVDEDMTGEEIEEESEIDTTCSSKAAAVEESTNDVGFQENKVVLEQKEPPTLLKHITYGRKCPDCGSNKGTITEIRAVSISGKAYYITATCCPCGTKYLTKGLYKKIIDKKEFQIITVNTDPVYKSKASETNKTASKYGRKSAGSNLFKGVDKTSGNRCRKCGKMDLFAKSGYCWECYREEKLSAYDLF